jgi:hypothetical protein
MAADDGVTVSITHPDGISLSYTENLVRFLVNRRDKHLPFFLGYWLKTLGHAELERFVSLAEQEMLNFATDEPVETGCGEDLMGVVVHVLAVETRNMKVSMEQYPFNLGMLYSLAAMEEARRAGWVALEGVLSLSEPARISATITEKGRKEMPESLRRAMH